MESSHRSDGSSIKGTAILETGLSYLVRPFLGKHDTLEVNRMHRQNDSGGYRKKNRYNVDELEKG